MPQNSTDTRGTTLSEHAAARMVHRNISSELIDSVVEYGRMVFTRGAVVHAIGRKEVEQYLEEDLNLSDCEGVQVVCSMEGVVLTAYRNQSFRGLRSGLGRGRHGPGNSRCHRTMAFA